MATAENWLDVLIGLRRFYAAGIELVKRAGINFGTGITAVDNPTTQMTDVSVNLSGLTMAGDVSGTAAAAVVGKIRGVSVSSTSPAEAQMLIYDSETSAWTPTSPPAIYVTSTSAAAALAAYYAENWGLPVTLMPLSTGADDWPRMIACANAVAGKVPLVLGPGTWQCKSAQLLPDDIEIHGTSTTRVLQTLTTGSGNPLIAAFAASESAGAFSTTLRADAVIGSRTLDITSVTGLNVGDVIKVIETTYRAVMYEVKAITVSAPHNYVTVDRPIRNALLNTNALATIIPARNITIRGNGMQIAGVGSRYIELINCWGGLITDVVFDSSSGLPDERFFSIDMCNVNVRAERLSGDGLGTLPIGVSFECTSDGCAFVDCEIARCVVGYAVQDAMSATLRDCRAIGCGVGCEMFGSDAGAGLGAQDCRIEGGSYSGSTTHGISIKDGSRRNVISGVSCVGNGNDGIVLSGASAMASNVITHCVCTNNVASGVDVAGGAIGTKIIGTDCSSCGCAFTVLSPATQTIMLDCSGSLSNGLINLSTDIDVTGFTGSVPANAGPGITCQGGAAFVGRGLNLSSPDASAGGTPVKIISMSNATCSCIIDGATITLGTNDWGLVPAFAGNTMRIKNVTINKAGGASGTYGIFQLGGTLYIEGGNVDNADAAWTLVNATRGTAAPSGGTWKVGDICDRVPRASGQPISWMCTVAGSPGTWVAGPNAP